MWKCCRDSVVGQTTETNGCFSVASASKNASSLDSRPCRPHWSGLNFWPDTV
eukprot:CAMPEP_0179021354 /NCGR_PEP_ID=MMETSP0796-20121207/5844_1 /TAXON_ID=73915 /ORGANISM="Pyrodinium bahamense, Strain pbaha01" /LENGTH=51 /DNA_ID=CAMNT_0020717177 /DNA_START=850 /DNA_END=1005 /DNA_ORIENTATION=+